MNNQQSIQKYKQALTKHQKFINKFHVFPSKSRKSIYNEILQLPLNYEHFSQLTKPYKMLPQHTNNKQVAFLISCLTKLYPDLNIQWLPGIIYPFVKLFEEDAIASFQISLTFLINWFIPILKDYPSPNPQVMKFFSRNLSKLQAKVNDLDYALSVVINPSLLVCLTDILNRKDSLQFLDFVVCHPYNPGYFICIAIEVIKSIQNQLCKQISVQKICASMRKEKKINIEKLINNAVILHSEQKYNFEKLYQHTTIFPIPKERYPIFQFITMAKKQQNQTLIKIKEQQIDEIGFKFEELKKNINEKLKGGIVRDAKDINQRYQKVEGQMNEYLDQIRKQNHLKLAALSEVQTEFKRNVEQQNKQRQQLQSQTMDAIERRGRIEKQIIIMQQQANKIKKIQYDLLRKISDVSKMKQAELLKQNLQLKEEQKKQKLF